MTKNNLKIVKSGKNQEIEAKEKNKALEAAISQIDENFGKGSVMKLGQKAALDIESISTGSLGLDLALGIGGLPKGRVIEIYGPEGSGKTTLALQVVAEAQKTNGYQLSKAIILDHDSEFDSKPELEIYADDVKCSHGSTSGSLDEDAIFYLMSRGLNRIDSRNLLIKGFLADAIETITNEEIKKYFLYKLENKINELK